MKSLMLSLCALALLCSPAWALKDRLEDGTAGQPKLLNMPMSESVNLNQVQERFNESESDANYKEYNYSPTLTMKLRLREYMNTTVVLPENEAIKAVSLGDEANFFCSPVRLSADAPAHIFEVWGKYPGADTSLKVYGESGNIYAFYLRIDSVASKIDPTLVCYVFDKTMENKSFGMAEASVKPGQDAAPAATPAPAAATPDKYAPKGQENRDTPDYLPELKDVDPSTLNFAYQVADPDSDLAPIRIFDDGHFTYFQYGEENLDKVRNLPALYRVVDGTDQPFTNLQKVGGYVIATTTHDRWTLRSGRQWLCIRAGK